MHEAAPRGFVQRGENAVAILVLAAMALLPIVEIAGRAVAGRGISGSIVVVQHLTLWIAIVGAVLAARSDRLLALSTLRFLPSGLQRPVRVFTSALAAGIAASLCLASVELIVIERQASDLLAWGVPVWLALLVLPIGFAVIAGRLVWGAAPDARGRLMALAGLGIPVLLGLAPTSAAGPGVVFALCFAIVVATTLGMPIFTAIGGAALVLFWADGTPITAVPGETYRLTTSPMLPAIPLFALGGYLLAEGGASQRLTRLFTAVFGWMPGGLAIVTTVVLAFFTPLTGASGVTILSMGGLLLPMLVRAGYGERTSVGLVTVSGSIGLLFFPSLPVFLYGFYANQPFERLFVAGVIPGLLLVVVVAGWAAGQGWLGHATRTPFSAREAGAAVRESKWDLFLPVMVLGTIATGVATLVEAAALTVAYTLLVECVIHRGLRISVDIPRVAVECATLIGGFMIILSVALGFTNYLVIAEVPMRALGWAQTHIESPIVFLLALNVFLIVVGALMDIYSAIVVVVPLITPMAAAYGIDPLHLAIVFLANMELGYLMPPMGENLFLSAYRFDKPLTSIYRSTLPYTAILLIAVLLITYVPWLTLGLVEVAEAAGLLAPGH